jgi:hypothetical protein
MLLKCYQHLHPMIQSKVECAKQTQFENSHLDVFEKIVNTSELTKELVHEELLTFKCY